MGSETPMVGAVLANGIMLGGISEGHRELYDRGAYGDFEQAVERLFGEKLRADREAANAFWGALANVRWLKGDDDIGYSFRAAGDFLAAIRRDEGTLTYMNYYCSVPDGVVPEWVAMPLAAEGWRWADYPMPDAVSRALTTETK